MHPTVDSIFTLKALIDKYMKSKSQKHRNLLFSCFVDFRKAFDCIPQQKLFDKLRKEGVQGHFLDVLISVYLNDKSAVNIENKFRQSFTCKRKVACSHPLFLTSVVRTTHITMDMSFTDGGTHKTRNMCFPGWGKNITSDICFLRRGIHNTMDMCFLGGETHITKGMCFPRREITRDMCFPRKGKHITRNTCFPGGGIHITRGMCFLGRGTHITRDMCFPSGGTHITRDICFLGGGTDITNGYVFPR